MRRFTVCLLMSCACLVLAACSSAPTHFYTLMPSPSTTPSTRHASYDIAVLPVTIPAQVDRPQMVVREGGGSVALLEGERWIAPLGNEIRNAISSDLTRRLGVKDVYGMEHRKDATVYRIKVNVDRFESVPGQYTLLSAAWSVHRAGSDQNVALCSSRIKVPVGPGYAALALGHQQGLKTLSGEIAMALRDLSRGTKVVCQAHDAQVHDE